MLKPSAVEQEFRRRIEQWQGDSEEVSCLSSWLGLATNQWLPINKNGLNRSRVDFEEISGPSVVPSSGLELATNKGLASNKDLTE